MGDLPEPRYHTMEKDNSSVMMKVTATLGRNFINSKEFKVRSHIFYDLAYLAKYILFCYRRPRQWD